MLAKIPIFATEVVEGSDGLKEFLIYSKNYEVMFDGNIFELEEIYRYTEARQPKTITIIGARLHGREIVTFLEYFLSRKYKLLLFELSLKRTPKNHRFIIIKLQKLV